MAGAPYHKPQPAHNKAFGAMSILRQISGQEFAQRGSDLEASLEGEGRGSYQVAEKHLLGIRGMPSGMP